MLPINNDTKIGRFWDYPKEMINDKTPEEIKIIIDYREKALNKVETLEWTKDEYKHFSSTIKVISIKRFVNFIDVASVLLEMPRKVSQKEIDYLFMDHFFLSNIKNKSKIHDLAELILFIQSKLYVISNLPMTEDEKDVTQNRDLTRPIEEIIEIYENLFSQIQDVNSDYITILKEFYREWVNKNFNNQELKDVLLIQEQKIIDLKEKKIREHLRNYKNVYGAKKNMAINSYFNTQAKKVVDKKIKERR